METTEQLLKENERYREALRQIAYADWRVFPPALSVASLSDYYQDIARSALEEGLKSLEPQDK